MAMNLKRLEIGGKPNEFQHNISYDGIENFCNFMSGRIQALRFEYCVKIGQESIAKIAQTMKENLKELAIIRNFNEKSSNIGDQAFRDLAQNCPNLKRLEIVYSRKFDNFIA